MEDPGVLDGGEATEEQLASEVCFVAMRAVREGRATEVLLTELEAKMERHLRHVGPDEAAVTRSRFRSFTASEVSAALG